MDWIHIRLISYFLTAVAAMFGIFYVMSIPAFWWSIPLFVTFLFAMIGAVATFVTEVAG